MVEYIYEGIHLKNLNKTREQIRKVVFVYHVGLVYNTWNKWNINATLPEFVFSNCYGSLDNPENLLTCPYIVFVRFLSVLKAKYLSAIIVLKQLKKRR